MSSNATVDHTITRPHWAKCLACATEWLADVWVSVDGPYHPELLRQIADDTIQDCVCPACGHEAYLRGQLLLHRGPIESPVFSLPWSVSAEQLAAWRDPLAAAVQAALTNEGHPAPATVTVSWDELRSIAATLAAHATPAPSDLPDPRRTSPALRALDRLGKEAANEYVSTSEDAALRKAIGCMQAAVERSYPEDEEFPARLMDLGCMLLNAYERDHVPSELEEAIELMRRARLLLPASETAARSVFAYFFGRAVLERYHMASLPSDFEEAEAAFAIAVEGPLPDDAIRASFRTLGVMKWGRARRDGRLDVAALDAAITALDRALELTSDAPLTDAGLLETLSDALELRAKATANDADVLRAIELRRTLVGGAATQAAGAERRGQLGSALLQHHEVHSDESAVNEAIEELSAAADALDGSTRVAAMDQLAVALRARFLLRGTVADLDRGIALLRDVTSAGIDQPMSQSFANLGTLLMERVAVSGNLSDHDAAIVAYERAVAMLTVDDRNRSTRLSSLALALARHPTNAARADRLDRAVDLARESVEAAGPASSDLPLCLTNLSTVLRQRFQLRRTQSPYGPDGVVDADDYFEALSSAHRAVALTDGASPHMPARQSMLGTLLHDQFGLAGQPSSIAESVRVFERIVGAAPPRSGQLPSALVNLGTSLLRRASSRAAEPDDLPRAQESLRKACVLGLELDLEACLQASITWGATTDALSAWHESVEAYGYGLTAIDRLYEVQLTTTSGDAWLRRAEGLGAHAAYALARTNDGRGAMIAIERNRARAVSEAVARERANLTRLAEARPDLVDAYSTAVRRLRRATESGAADVTASARGAFHAALAAVRGEPGYERFLADVTWDDIAAAVQPGSPLVTLITTGQGTVALTLKQDANGAVQVEPTWIEDFRSRDLQALLTGDVQAAEAGWFRAYWNRSEDLLAWLSTIDRVMGAVGTRVIGAICAALGDQRRATIVPVGQWSFLPLHAAWVRDADGERQYVAEKLDIAYAPSARALAVAVQQSGRPAEQLLLIDNPQPVTDAEPLLLSALETAAVARFFGRVPSTTLSENGATRDTVLQSLSTAHVAHFSCHGVMNWQEADHAGLLMANDEWIQVADVAALDLPVARLATLSACETGLVGVDLPDEAVAFPSVLLRAGFAGVISTLWPVAEKSTAMLMERFYRLWRVERHEPATALHLAQQWLRDSTDEQFVAYYGMSAAAKVDSMTRAVATQFVDGLRGNYVATQRRYQHPFFWAGFYFTGA